MLDQVYDAIADPTRREILAILAAGDTNVGTLADRFPISLNGVSKHVKVLERAGLVHRTIQGREHRLRLNAQPLMEASAWLDHYRGFWNSRLASLEEFLKKEGERPMTATETAAPVLEVRRHIAVPRQRVFDAWLDSEAMARWMRPGKVTHSTVSLDPRVGGSFRILMHGPNGEDFDHRGEYLVIESPSRLSFTWISKGTDHKPTVVTIEFLESGNGTELVLTHEQLAPKAIEGHRGGWTDAIRVLDETLTGRIAG